MEKGHPEVLAIKHNLAELYFAMGNEEKGSEMAKEVMDSLEGK